MEECTLLVFEKEFEKSKGKPITYKGKIIRMWDQFQLPRKEIRLKFRIISTNSEWRQGISLKTTGSFFFGNDREFKNSIGIWEDTASSEDIFLCKSDDLVIEVVNVWDTGDGVIQSWHNGAAMWYEEIRNGKRYHCNDGHPDDDFDDIIFEIQIINDSR